MPRSRIAMVSVELLMMGSVVKFGVEVGRSVGIAGSAVIGP